MRDIILLLLSSFILVSLLGCSESIENSSSDAIVLEDLSEHAKLAKNHLEEMGYDVISYEGDSWQEFSKADLLTTPAQQIWSVQYIKPDEFLDKRIDTVRFTIKNHPLDHQFGMGKTKATVYIFNDEVIGGWSYPIAEGGVDGSPYSLDGKTTEEIYGDFQAWKEELAAAEKSRSCDESSASPSLNTIKLYFNCTESGVYPSPVKPVLREMNNDKMLEDKIEFVIQQLIKGPTDEELKKGFASAFNTETADMLHDIELQDNGHLIVDFFDFSTVIPNASTTSGSSHLLPPLNVTISQFNDVQTIEYQFEGSCEAFYEWIQIGSCKHFNAEDYRRDFDHSLSDSNLKGNELSKNDALLNVIEHHNSSEEVLSDYEFPDSIKEGDIVSIEVKGGGPPPGMSHNLEMTVEIEKEEDHFIVTLTEDYNTTVNGTKAISYWKYKVSVNGVKLIDKIEDGILIKVIK